MFRVASHSVGIFIALSLLDPAGSLLAGASPPPSFLLGRDGIQRRNGEHVVLADCRDANAVVSSQIAYFEGSPGRIPKDVAVVHTKPGEAALWVNAKTSGLFTDTGVTFIATIGPKVADGDFAGIGHNGFGGFACWQKYFNNLYEYGGTTCSQVYFCNHDPLPPEAATMIFTQTSNSPTAGVGTTTSNPTAVTTSSGDGGTTSMAVPADPSIPTAASSDNGLSQGALIGIIVGVVGTFAVTASVAFFLWTWRKYRDQQPPTNSGRSGGCCGLFITGRKSQQSPPEPFAAHAVPPGGIPLAPQDMKRGPPGMYELEGVWYRVEMAEGNGKFELDGTSRFDRDFDADKKLVVPEGLGGPQPPASQKTGYPEIYARTPATSATEISEQKVRIQDL
ncbi:hypothetical protein QBC34DRAFT_123860 [Podospora aff. communis PSN243]|uniref:SH3 domain-containing protein n=1 Tax=Podospora aff. communis PSN243 TaxID=3040156 RepID=A0AAV9GI72_9PEZI|nr:hypothetical protein QBC34DRAFT_123860 [Podospora aff. communis PSN243]